MKTQGLTKAIRDILSDGEWHEVHKIVAGVRNIIPPEVAARAYYRRHKGQAVKMWKGYFIVTRKAIRGLVRIGAIETRRDEGGKIVAVRLAVEVEEAKHD